MDIAELGLSVRSDGVVIADKRLDGLARGAKKAETATERLIRKTEKMNATMKKMGRNMTMFATLPIVGLLGGAVKAFGNFDEAMVSSMAIMGDLSDTMQKDMADTAKQVALSTAFSAKQAAESYYFLASAGLDAAASMAALPKVAAFAQAGNFDMAKATDILTDAQSALGMAMKDPIENMGKMVELSDVLVKAGTLANASVQQFGEALTNKAGTAMKLLNIDIESGVAVLAAWADQGIKATEAGEKFNIVTRDLQTAYRKNTQAFIDQGVHVFDSLGNFRNMADIIGELEVAMSKLTPEQQGNTLALMGFQDRSVMAIKSLLGLSEKIATYEKGLRSAGDITDEVANKQMQTFNKQMGLMKDKLVGIGIELGEKLVPLMESLRESLDDFLEWLREAVDAFTAYDVETQKMILGAIAFAAALGPILMVLGALTSAIMTLTPIVVAFGAAFAAVPFAGIALGIGLVATALATLYLKHMEDAIGVTGEFITAIDTLDQKILKTNILRVSDQLDEYVRDQEKIANRLRTVNNMIDQANSGLINDGALPRLLKEQAELNVELDEANAIVAAQIRLRDSYTERIAESTLRMNEEADAAQRYADTMAEMKANFEWLEGSSPEVSTPGMSKEELEALTDWWKTLRAEMDPAAEAARQYEEATAMLTLAIKEFGLSAEQEAAAIAQLQQNMADANGSTELLDWFAALQAEIDPVAEATRVYREEVAKLDKVIAKKPKGTIDRAKAIAFLKKEMKDASGETAKLTAAQDKFTKAMQKYGKLKALIDPAGAALDEFNEKLKEMNEIREELEKNGVMFSEDHWDAIEDGLERATLGTMSLGENLEKAGSLAGDALRLVQSSMSRNTKEFEAMNIAIQAANVTKAIGAILTQGQGDPYTAFARMAAMAAAVASLGVSISGFSDVGEIDPTEERQAAAGAGSVLGDAEEKSESIMNALEITADSTSELVGINRGMLKALTSLQTGLTGASTQLVRGGVDGSEINLPDVKNAGWVDTLGSIIDAFDIFGLGIGDFITRLIGGKTKLLDTGIQIEGGHITDLINEVMVQAFADIKSKKWFGGSYKNKTIFEGVDDQIGQQLALVFSSIVDTVMEAAIAIGLPLDVLEERLAAFEVETQKISLEGLSGEEQQQALLDVFSKIFDDLALDIIPFVGDFQKIGEGLGETLVRVATSVQVMQEALKMLGTSVDETDPEKFAAIAVGMMELAGGIDEFISKLKNFVGKFSTKEWQDAITLDAVTRGFEQLGIAIPGTREALWDLVQGLDLTTESGQEQLATILDLTDSLDQYYDILEEADAARIAAEEARAAALDAEVQALLHIQSIAEGIAASLKALRDRIIGDTSTDEENYNRYKAAADDLVVDLATMTDPDLIAETVAEIERLTNLAWGLLDDSQKEKMAEGFLTFLTGVEELALERLGIAADEAVAGTEFTPEEILARFNDLVTEPLILTAGIQESAAMKLNAASDKLLEAVGSDFQILADADGNPDVTIEDVAIDPAALEQIQELIAANERVIDGFQEQVPAISEAVSVAVEAGLQAGAEAMVAAARSIVSSGDETASATVLSARTIANAVNSIPSRIVVESKTSEFS